MFGFCAVASRTFQLVSLASWARVFVGALVSFVWSVWSVTLVIVGYCAWCWLLLHWFCCSYFLKIFLGLNGDSVMFKFSCRVCWCKENYNGCNNVLVVRVCMYGCVCECHCFCGY